MTNKAKFQHWALNLDKDNLAWLCFDKHESSANVLSASVLEEFASIVEQLQLNLPMDDYLLGKEKWLHHGC
jgi:3-hydroxyacyl-CoA dehydrogenase/enoyl-CoA hydratase/3-hydroxybutyryl-CoA epimerase